MNAPPPFRCLRFRLYYTFSRHFNTCLANIESTFGKVHKLPSAWKHSSERDCIAQEEQPIQRDMQRGYHML